MVKRTRRSGQGMVEYIILVGLIGLMAIEVAEKHGHKLQRGFGQVTFALDQKVTSKIGKPSGSASTGGGTTVGEGTIEYRDEEAPPAEPPKEKDEKDGTAKAETP